MGTNLYIDGGYCNVSGNFISDNKYGIFLDKCANTTVFNNTVVNHSEIGIGLGDPAQNNVIYMNKIVNNTGANGWVDPAISQGANNWDDGVNGNYWGDYYCERRRNIGKK